MPDAPTVLDSLRPRTPAIESSACQSPLHTCLLLRRFRKCARVRTDSKQGCGFWAGIKTTVLISPPSPASRLPRQSALSPIAGTSAIDFSVYRARSFPASFPAKAVQVAAQSYAFVPNSLQTLATPSSSQTFPRTARSMATSLASNSTCPRLAPYLAPRLAPHLANKLASQLVPHLVHAWSVISAALLPLLRVRPSAKQSLQIHR